MSLNLPLDPDRPYISFVVPFFASHDRLQDCVASIRRHVSVPHEIVLIDDGNIRYDFSWLEQQDGIQLVRQSQNAGPGAARNAGIKEATGQYIQFIDSDDELMADPAQYFHEASKLEPGKNIDIIVGVLEGGTINNRIATQFPTLTRLSDNPVLIKMASFTAHLYRRGFLVENAIEFPTDTISAEDTAFLARAFAKAADLIITDVAVYRYVEAHESISRRPFDWESYRMRFGISAAHIMEALASNSTAQRAKVSQIFKYGVMAAKKNLLKGYEQHQPDAVELLRKMVIGADLLSDAAIEARRDAFVYWDENFDQCTTYLINRDAEGFFHFIENTPLRIFKHQQPR